VFIVQSSLYNIVQYSTCWQINWLCFVLDMAEPAYEYTHPPDYHPTPRKYPHKEPFDRYSVMFYWLLCLFTAVLLAVLFLYLIVVQFKFEIVFDFTCSHDSCFFAIICGKWHERQHDIMGCSSSILIFASNFLCKPKSKKTRKSLFYAADACAVYFTVCTVRSLLLNVSAGILTGTETRRTLPRMCWAWDSMGRIHSHGIRNENGFLWSTDPKAIDLHGWRNAMRKWPIA